MFDFRESWTQSSWAVGGGGRREAKGAQEAEGRGSPPSRRAQVQMRSSGSDAAAARWTSFPGGGLGGWTPRASRPLPVSSQGWRRMHGRCVDSLAPARGPVGTVHHSYQASRVQGGQHPGPAPPGGCTGVSPASSGLTWTQRTSLLGSHVLKIQN